MVKCPKDELPTSLVARGIEILLQHAVTQDVSIYDPIVKQPCNYSGSSISMVSHTFITNACFDQTNLMPADDAQLKLYDWQRLSKLKRCTFSDAIKKKRARDKETVLCESLDGLKISKKKDECLTSAMKKLCLSPVPVPVPAAMCQA